MIIMVVLIVGFAGFLIYNSQSNPAENGEQAVEQSQHIKGQGTSGVEVVEFGDFGCPGCHAYYPTMQQVAQHYGDEISFQFKHFVLPAHERSLAAAKVAEAAGEQGKFWEMHDILFEQFEAWRGNSNPTELFESYAQQLELDIEKFRSDRDSRTINTRINLDREEGEEEGATSTPTFIINGQKVETPRNNLEFFQQLIDEAIAEAETPQQ